MEFDSPIMDTNTLAAKAIVHIGPKGIPRFFKMLQANDSQFKFKITALLSRQKVVDIKHTPARRYHDRAVYALYILGGSAEPMMPQLLMMLHREDTALPAIRAIHGIYSGMLKDKQTTDRDKAMAHVNADNKVISECIATLDGSENETQRNVRSTIKLISHKNHAVAPSLIVGLYHTNATVREFCATIIGMEKMSSDSVLPVLIRSLDDSNPAVRKAVIFALWNLGVQAKAAIPALEMRLQDPDPEVRRNVVDVLDSLRSATNNP
jgi:hypothetical protein